MTVGAFDPKLETEKSGTGKPGAEKSRISGLSASRRTALGLTIGAAGAGAFGGGALAGGTGLTVRNLRVEWGGVVADAAGGEPEGC